MTFTPRVNCAKRQYTLSLILDVISPVYITATTLSTFLDAVATCVPSWLIAMHASSLWWALIVMGDDD